MQTSHSNELEKSVAQAIAKEARPVFSQYQLGLLVFNLIVEAGIDGRRRPKALKSRHYSDAVGVLTSFGVLLPLGDSARDMAYARSGHPKLSAAEVACSLDPFAYVSHLSAMDMHGLTDRVAQTLYISTPDPKQWRKFAVERMQRDLGARLEQYQEAGFPLLTRPRLEKLEDRPVNLFASSHLGAFRRTPNSETRVSTLGRTFLDMLRHPEYCGGIHHVLSIYAAHAAQYLDLIAAEIDQHGGPIDKVRCGYVLEEVCELHHPSMDAWRKLVARGGSRKLVADREYSPRYSERWSLSLNAD